MNPLAALLLHTPLPWLMMMYVAAYRHDLGRFTRPLADHASLTEWWSVCRELGLTAAGTERPAAKPWESGLFVAVLASSLISTFWMPISTPLDWYYLCALQAGSALPLFLVLHSRIGPLPYRPFRDFLPYPRLGTRVRHLKKRKGSKRGPLEQPRPANPSVGGGPTS